MGGLPRPDNNGIAGAAVPQLISMRSEPEAVAPRRKPEPKVVSRIDILPGDSAPVHVEDGRKAAASPLVLALRPASEPDRAS